MIDTKRVRTRETIELPAVRDLILRAVTVTRYPGAKPEVFYLEVARRITKWDFGAFVGYDGIPQALAIVLLPDTSMMMAPQIPLVYNEGKPELIRALSKRVRDWIREAGYVHAIGVNLWHSDRAFMRGFSHLGKPKRLGSLIEFDLT